MTKEELFKNPQKLKFKKLFYRGAQYENHLQETRTYGVGELVESTPPNFKRKVVFQDQFVKELDPNCHDVLFDENLPSICVKLNDGGFREIKFVRIAVPYQMRIRDKKTQHLAGNKIDFTLNSLTPNDKEENFFIKFKQYWSNRNQEGMKFKAVETQLSFGDMGWLFYYDDRGQIKSRILSYADGYNICSHRDKNGEIFLEAVNYYKGNVECIDCYDRYNFYSFECDYSDPKNETGWVMTNTGTPHGFSEIPLITKRGNVAWNEVQVAIENYEVIYNIFIAIQKRMGWGILYIKGQFSDKGRKLAGNVILNDTSTDGKGDAKFLTPPSPDGMLDTLKSLEEVIMKGSSTTFILPQDIKTTGDVSATAIRLAQELDIEGAERGVIEWQNVIDKAIRLFKEGLAKELVNKGEIAPLEKQAFEGLNISGKMSAWQPVDEYMYNSMLVTLKSNGLISQKTAIEANTESKPDELQRVKVEEENNEESTDEETQDSNQNIGFKIGG